MEGGKVPTIVRLGNVLIRLFADDHNPPHFHVVASGREAMVSLADFSVIAGSIDRQSLKVALEWATMNPERLQNEWDRLNER